MTFFANLSFEDPDPDPTLPGRAASWTWAQAVPLAFATYATPTGVSRFEGFELGWGADPFADSLVVPTNANRPATDPIETFEIGWRLPNTPPPDVSHPGNETALLELGAAVAAEYGTPPHTFDGFESGWQNDTYETAFAIWDLFVGSTDTFNAGWQNDTYETAFAGGDLSTAMFVNGADPVEGFETFRAPIRATADSVMSAFTTDGAHDFSNGDAIRFSADDSTNDGRLPAGIDPGLTYYALVPGYNQLNVSLSPFGPAVAFTDNGIGPLSVSADPRQFWTLTDVGV